MTNFEIFVYGFAVVGFIVTLAMVLYFGKYFVYAIKCFVDKYKFAFEPYEEE